MKRNFIKNIFIEESRNINLFDIRLSDKNMKHLILTGKNGSGKTSLLNDIHKYLYNLQDGSIVNYDILKKEYRGLLPHLSRLEKNGKIKSIHQEIASTKKNIKRLEKNFARFSGININFSDTPGFMTDEFNAGNYIVAFFEARRFLDSIKPKGIQKFNIKEFYGIKDTPGKNFLQHLVNLKAERSFANDDNDSVAVANIDKWFNKFEQMIKGIYQDQELELKFDRKKYSFFIKQKNKLPSDISTLADGHSAILKILSELIMRVDRKQGTNFDCSGVVLIDEIETHLHVELQKIVLPFLINYFPNIQFIVSTHSPFVLSSISDCIIFDLEKMMITNDLTGYSYDTLIESYFGSDKYSELLKDKVNRYEEILKSGQLSNDEREEIGELEMYLLNLPVYLSKELEVKLQELELLKISKQKK